MSHHFDDVLYAACVQALGPAPVGAAEQSAWIGQVGQLYTSLSRDKARLGARMELMARIEAPKEVRERGFGVASGTLLSVDQAHGRGVLTVKMDGESKYDDDGMATFRTEWLNTPEGAGVFALAESMVGESVRVWKYSEPHSQKPGQTVRMVAHLERVAGGADTIDDSPADTPPPVTEPPVTEPPVTDAASAVAPVTSVPDSGQVPVAIDGTPLDELRDLTPENIRELRSWAADKLGFEQDRVTQIARRILKGKSGGERTPAELRSVWKALIAHFVNDTAKAA